VEWISEVRYVTSPQFEALEAAAGFSLSEECRRAINEAIAVSFVAGGQTFNQADKIALEAVARTAFAFVKAICELQQKHPGLDFDLAALGADRGNNRLWADPRANVRRRTVFEVSTVSRYAERVLRGETLTEEQSQQFKAAAARNISIAADQPFQYRNDGSMHAAYAALLVGFGAERKASMMGRHLNGATMPDKYAADALIEAMVGVWESAGRRPGSGTEGPFSRFLRGLWEYLPPDPTAWLNVATARGFSDRARIVLRRVRARRVAGVKG
jgi:hypothetical protein